MRGVGKGVGGWAGKEDVGCHAAVVCGVACCVTEKRSLDQSLGCMIAMQQCLAALHAFVHTCIPGCQADSVVIGLSV